MYKNLALIIFSIFFLIQTSHAKVPVAGDPAPDFSLTSVTGEKIALSGLKGKVVLIGMFHICVPCMKHPAQTQLFLLNQTKRSFLQSPKSAKSLGLDPLLQEPLHEKFG
jgi:hypothetical protein